MTGTSRLLLIGPLPIEGDVIGGTKVSFGQLVTSLSECGSFEVEVQNTSRAQTGRGRCARFVNDARQLGSMLWRLMASRRPDLVFFNTSSGGALLSAPLVWGACRLRRVPMVLRIFGGDFDLFHERASVALRWIARRTFMRAELVLLQTKALCEKYARDMHTSWWPTTRELFEIPRSTSQTARKFLFIGQLRREKGIAEVLEAAEDLPADASLTVYGPAMPGFDCSALLSESRGKYGGPLPADQVQSALEQADVLLFPSYHSGEGMPGILIEAFQVGLPIIATDWRALGELVQHEGNGLLVQARDAKGLAQAMNRLHSDPELFRALRQGALETGRRFRTSSWIQVLKEDLERLCHRQPILTRPRTAQYREVA